MRRKIPEEFPERLRKFTKNKNYRAASELCGLGGDVIRRCEKGKADPKLTTLIQIAKTYDVSLDYLAGLKDNPKIKT